MTRGSVIRVADRAGDFTGKPRPAVVVQSGAFDGASLTVCPLTSSEADAPLLRLRVDPHAALPLDRTSWIMVDKITTIRANRVGPVIGAVGNTDMVRLNAMLAVFLGLG
ncbi:type II toxin-antitoxin system PemK/MazF family toxin [Lichenicoccus sp.]|uniref:type II toxin-antitoxin system PemK/MazF family toxin n=1 Tax=Lichenicoccus sp. TaxID=2781899 RepID=UPI003D13BFF9